MSGVVGGGLRVLGRGSLGVAVVALCPRAGCGGAQGIPRGTESSPKGYTLYPSFNPSNNRRKDNQKLKFDKIPMNVPQYSHLGRADVALWLEVQYSPAAVTRT